MVVGILPSVYGLSSFHYNVQVLKTKKTKWLKENHFSIIKPVYTKVCFM